MPGRVAQSVGHLIRKSGALGSIPGLATYFRFSFRFFKKGSCQLLAKVREVLVNRLGGLPWKSVVRLTDRPDMTLDVYRGRKTTIQHNSSYRHHSGPLPLAFESLEQSFGGKNCQKYSRGNLANHYIEQNIEVCFGLSVYDSEF